MLLNDQALRHLPFFDELAALEEHESAWRAASAGLVTLRMVDRWVEEGPGSAADTWGTRPVLAAIEQMDEGSSLPAILKSVVEALQSSHVADMHDVIPRLMAYGRALEYDAKWTLAIDVYDTIITHAHPAQESESATGAHLRRGICLRTMGRFDSAVQAFADAATVAGAAGDMMGVLRARIGDARVAVARGNLPHAERVLEDTIQSAAQLRMTVVHSEALHDRAMVAGLRGHHDVAVQLAYQALRECATQAHRDRILNDIGTAFQSLGLRSVARDAFLVLSVTAQEQYMRWVAKLSLMEIAAEDGLEPIFEQHKGDLYVRELPPKLETEYYLRLGRAYCRLSHEDLGQIALSKAVELAEHYGYFGMLFEAEDAIARAASKRVPSSEVPPDMSTIALEMHSMRLAAVAAS